MEAHFHNSRLVHYDASQQTGFKDAEQRQAESWIDVDSSNVKAICWRPGDGEPKTGLGIWFDPIDKKTGRRSGKEAVYFYPKAAFSVYKRMLGVDSKGKFVHEVVIPNFPHDGPYPPGA